MNTEPSPKMRIIKAAITRFEKATRVHAFKGATDPEDHPSVEYQYEAAKSSLISLIERNLK